MRDIPLEAIPNQELTVNIEGNRWTLRIKECNESMAVDVSLDDVPLVQGVRISVGTPILPYEYLQEHGNFLLLVDREELPDYRKFGSGQALVFALPGEV